MGQLGEHFSRVNRKPDPYRLRAIEARPTGRYPLEGDELKKKFNVERDDAFYEKIIVVSVKHSLSNTNKRQGTVSLAEFQSSPIW